MGRPSVLAVLRLIKPTGVDAGLAIEVKANGAVAHRGLIMAGGSAF
jgi:hypothetical protein